MFTAAFSVVALAWLMLSLARPARPPAGPFWVAGGCVLLAVLAMSPRLLLQPACFSLLLLITPFLANYLVMNLMLFLVLFAFGFMTARIPGINFWMQLGYLV